MKTNKELCKEISRDMGNILLNLSVFKSQVKDYKSKVLIRDLESSYRLMQKQFDALATLEQTNEI